MVNVTALSGTSSISVELSNATVAGLLSHPAIQGLGLGDNVDVKSGGVVLDSHATLIDGQTVSFSQRKSGKGC